MNKKAMNRFILNNMKNKLEGYVLTVTIIKHYLNEGNDKEVAHRSKHLRMDGLSPPTNLRECDEMIRDLRTWYI
jgi:hypothetical protein